MKKSLSPLLLALGIQPPSVIRMECLSRAVLTQRRIDQAGLNEAEEAELDRRIGKTIVDTAMLEAGLRRTLASADQSSKLILQRALCSVNELAEFVWVLAVLRKIVAG